MEISESSDLFLLIRNNSPLWLAPDLNGIAVTLDPQPTLFRSAYCESLDDQSILAARGWLAGEQHWLLALAPCPDGPPYRSAFLFVRRSPDKVTAFQDGKYTRHGTRVMWYQRATPATSLGSGFFLTGTTGDSLWRLFRRELDPFNRWILTLSPIQLSSQCPQADFSSLKTPLLAQEVAAHYAEMARAINTNSYREVVTKAKNIVEAIVAERLGTTSKSRDLADNLKVIKNFLENNETRESCGWTDIQYHLANKIRLVHGQTHATAPARTGRVLRPEFALSTVEDLIDLLCAWGHCKP